MQYSIQKGQQHGLVLAQHSQHGFARRPEGTLHAGGAQSLLWMQDVAGVKRVQGWYTLRTGNFACQPDGVRQTAEQCVGMSCSFCQKASSTAGYTNN